MQIGLISDTHGLLRPEVMPILEGSELILHAGDVGRPEILAALGSIAPVQAVRGNVDRGEWSQTLPQTREIEAAGAVLYMIHDLADLNLDPAAAGFVCVISGHSHVPQTYHKNGVIYVNPGSAGPRRFRLPVSLARLVIEDGQIEVEIIDLKA